MNFLNDKSFLHITNALKGYASRHKLINDIVIEYNNLQSQNRKYPLMYVKPGEITMLNGENRYTFEISFLTVNKNNYISAMNDMQRLVEQFFNFFHEINWQGYAITLDEDSKTLTPVEITSDKAIGWKTTFVIIAPKNIYGIETPIDWEYTDASGNSIAYPDIPDEIATKSWVNSQFSNISDEPIGFSISGVSNIAAGDVGTKPMGLDYTLSDFSIYTDASIYLRLGIYKTTPSDWPVYTKIIDISTNGVYTTGSLNIDVSSGDIIKYTIDDISAGIKNIVFTLNINRI